MGNFGGTPVYKEDGELVLAIVTMRDVTRQKLLEHEREQLLTREQAARIAAQESNRLKDEFLAIISHELRTPLNAILGWTQLLQRGNPSLEATHRALGMIERNSLTQARIVDDILDVSRIINGKMTLQRMDIPLHPVVEQALEVVQFILQDKGLTLETHFVTQPLYISGDINRLQQILWNLLTNAVKFTPAGGKVWVTLTNTTDQAVLTIQDTGEGIAPEFLPHIFERFRQADGSTTLAHGGLGLGLAIVHSLVELHGGTITALSPGVGQGAQFTLTLPLVKLP